MPAKIEAALNGYVKHCEAVWSLGGANRWRNCSRLDIFGGHNRLEIGDVVFKFNLIVERFDGELLLGEGAVRIFVGGRSINIAAVGAILYSAVLRQQQCSIVHRCQARRQTRLMLMALLSCSSSFFVLIKELTKA
eukprot:scaffold7807_cov95-Skeletonema_dohrnii-CCMP3373.AAC.9